jgi:hypothetical protein
VTPPPETDVEALAATVRGAISCSYQLDEHITGQSFDSQRATSLDALTALLQRIETLENKLNADSQNFELECRKAQIETLTRERDEARELAQANAVEVNAWRARDPLRTEAKLAEAEAELVVADQLAEWVRVTVSVDGVFSNNLGAQAQAQGLSNLLMRYAALRSLRGETP